MISHETKQPLDLSWPNESDELSVDTQRRLESFEQTLLESSRALQETRRRRRTIASVAITMALVTALLTYTTRESIRTIPSSQQIAKAEPRNSLEAPTVEPEVTSGAFHVRPRVRSIPAGYGDRLLVERTNAGPSIGYIDSTQLLKLLAQEGIRATLTRHENSANGPSELRLQPSSPQLPRSTTAF